MRITSSWINDHIRRTMLGDAEIVQALERAGIEVEHVILSPEIDKRVVIALTKKVIQHPEADRLKIVFTQVGEKEFQVVCGAPNVREGMKVAFAQIGATLPDGTRIEKAKLRGEISDGMLCSARELGLSDDHTGLIELPDDAEVGSTVANLFPAEAIIDVKTAANRFDVQSIAGLAREISGMTDAQATPLTILEHNIVGDTSVIADQVEASRYMITRLNVGQDHGFLPREITSRLQAIGVRSISPIVDITNYVLMDVGQPLHAFDAAKLRLPLSVRLAHSGETLVTLDGEKRELTPEDLVIVDGSGPIALAGVMGGQSTEVTAETTEILLEAAVFDAVRIRKTAQRHGLRTEASSRYERGISPELPSYGTQRAIELLSQHVGASVEVVYESPYSPEQPTMLTTKLSHITKLLGFGITHQEALKSLAKLGIEPARSNGDEVVTVAVPWWRPDLKEPEDLVEEIARVVGYDRVPATIPAWRPRQIAFDHTRAKRTQLRDLLWAAGGFEVMTYSFVSRAQLEAVGLDPDVHLKLQNPLSSEQSHLRSSLLASHLTVLEQNRLFADHLSFYEISKVFLPRDSDQLPDEPLRLGVMVREPAGAYRAAKGRLDILAESLGLRFELRATGRWAYAEGRYAEIWLGGKQIGGIGQIDPRLLRSSKIEGEAAAFELDVEQLLRMAAVPEYRPVHPYPSTSRDISLLVPEAATWGEMSALTEDWDVTHVSDYYSDDLPDGMRAVTIRVELTLPDRTPTEAEATKLEEQVLSRLNQMLGIVRRN